MHFHFSRKLILLLKIKIKIAYPEKQIIFSKPFTVVTEIHIQIFCCKALLSYPSVLTSEDLCLCLRRNYGAGVRHLTRLTETGFSVMSQLAGNAGYNPLSFCHSSCWHEKTPLSPFCCPYLAYYIFKLSFKEEIYFV